MRGCGRSSRDDLLVQRAPAPPFHELCRMSVDRIHRRRRLPCHTHHTGATDTPTFLRQGWRGRAPVSLLLDYPGKPLGPPPSETPLTAQLGCLGYLCSLCTRLKGIGHHHPTFLFETMSIYRSQAGLEHPEINLLMPLKCWDKDRPHCTWLIPYCLETNSK